MDKQRPTQKQRISCKRCQDRKIKCSRVSPCQRCVTANVQCEFRGDGLKRAPISRDYVTALERRIGALEGLLTELSPATGSEHEIKLNAIGFGGYSSPVSVSPDTERYHNVANNGAILTQNNNDPVKYQGPSSLRSSKILESANRSRSIHQDESCSAACIDIQPDIPGHIVAQCVALFFRWQYPQCMFIDRDKFLLGFLNHSYPSSNFSRCLEYSICALGALMSSDKKIRDLADSFSESAIRSLESGNLLHPQETSIQALTLCSFYLIGKGSFSRASMLSGIALRMYEDLNDGVEVDLNPLQNTSRDIESRRRMFLNLYQSDKMVSLLLGRSPVISKTTLIGESSDPERAPCIWPMWLEQNGLSEFHASETSVNPISVSRQQAELCNIINDMLLPSQSAWRGSTPLVSVHRWTDVVISELNARLCGWHNNLPSDLRWNRWGSCFDTIDPSIAALHMLFHTSQISLNLPFLAATENQAVNPFTASSKLVTDALEICGMSVDIIVSVLRRFKSQYTLKKASLILVHGAITAADAVVAMMRFHGVEETVFGDSNLRALNEALLELSYSWDIADKASAGLRGATSETALKPIRESSGSLSLRELASASSSDFEPYTPASFENVAGMNTTEGYSSEMILAGNCGMVDPYIWDSNLMGGECLSAEEFQYTDWP